MAPPDRKFLPYGRQSIDENDRAAVAAVLSSDMLTTGPEVGAFADALAAATGARHAVPCSSGTAALHLAALALSLAPGDRVIVPSLTFVATANAARYVGAEVIFADVDPNTGLMGPDQLEAAIDADDGSTARAVFPVHLNGQCADPAAIADIAARHGLKVVEDAAHSIGASYSDRNGKVFRAGCCAHADLAIFSFHPVKTTAMGEGGAVTTNDDALYERLSRLVNHGLTHQAADFRNRELAFDDTGAPNPWYYELPELGFNYRASDIHCALGRSQLAKLPRFVARRQALVERYAAALAALSPVVHPVTRAAGCTPAWHLMVALIDFAGAGVSRAETMNRLREHGIGSQVHYLPVHLQPYYRDRYGETTLPGAERYYQRALSLPLFVDMSDGDVDRVVGALGESLGLV